jgi:hypothetical protein
VPSPGARIDAAKGRADDCVLDLPRKPLVVEVNRTLCENRTSLDGTLSSSPPLPPSLNVLGSSGSESRAAPVREDMDRPKSEDENGDSQHSVSHVVHGGGGGRGTNLVRAVSSESPKPRRASCKVPQGTWLETGMCLVLH